MATSPKAVVSTGINRTTSTNTIPTQPFLQGPPLGTSYTVQQPYDAGNGSTFSPQLNQPSYPVQNRQPHGMSQSLYIPPTQPQHNTFNSAQSAYPQHQPSQPVVQPYNPPDSESHPTPSDFSANDPLFQNHVGTGSNPALPVPFQGFNSGMAQSMYLPGGSRAPTGYGGKRIDDRAAAKSLANMF